MAKVIDYEYITEISTEEALKNAVSDISNWYNWGIPWVNTYKINAETSIYNGSWWDWQGIAGWSTDVNWYASDYNTVAWWSWNVYLPDWTTLTISSGNTGDMSSTTYIYYDQSTWNVVTTTNASSSVGKDKILLCVAAPTTSWKDAEFQAFGTNAQSTFITANQIAANTITANEIASNSIDTRHLRADSVSSDKISVSNLSAISANLWTITAWEITGVKITASTRGLSINKSIILNPNDWAFIVKIGSTEVWRIYWDNVSWVWNTMYFDCTNIATNGKLYCLRRLRIPVWTDLYD